MGGGRGDGQIIFYHENVVTVLLEYFAGEKPLQMSQINRKFDPLQSRSGKERVYLLVII